MNIDGIFATKQKIGTSILCVIDLSGASRNAVREAINIATSMKARLTVLYPYRLNQARNVSDLTQWKKNIESDATSNFSRMNDTLLKEIDVLWEFKPEVGFVGDRIEAFSHKHSVGLIVMSSALMYANCDALSNVINKLNSPLLIIPDKENPES